MTQLRLSNKIAKASKEIIGSHEGELNKRHVPKIKRIAQKYGLKEDFMLTLLLSYKWEF